MRQHKIILTVLLFSAWAIPAFAEKAEHDVGFPQINQVHTFPSQVFWLMVAFFVLYSLMSSIALPRIEAVLVKRKALRQKNLDDAEKLNGQAVQLQKSKGVSLAEAQSASHKMISAAEEKIATHLAEENSLYAEKLRAHMQKIEQEILTSKEVALTHVEDVAAEVATDIASKLVPHRFSKPEAVIQLSEVVLRKGRA